MKLPHSPLLLPVCLFTLGASLYNSLPISLYSLFIFGLLLLAFLVFLYFLKTFPKLQLILLYLSFSLFGVIYFKAYYQPAESHYLNDNEDTNKIKEIELIRVLSSTSFSNNYIGKLTYSGGQLARGTLLVRQDKDSSTKVWPLGTKLITTQKSKPLSDPLNPGQFSYKEYLINQKIYHQIHLTTQNSILLKSTDRNLNQTKHNFKRLVFEKIESSRLNPQSQGMLKALLFAERKALDPKIIEDYTQAGVIHLLALSGLHIGLLVGFLMVLFSPISRLKYGKPLRTLFVLLVLWSFAYLIDFPPSVTRAVTLFSFIVIGKSIAFGQATFHYTVLSFLILLLCYPPFLKSIGFQLSYLAVVGILLIYPLFQALWSPKQKLIKLLWEWTGVCLAAQLAVSPVSIYYFHQFPSLFLLSNLMIIPFFGFFLIFCALILGLMWINSLPENLAVLFDKTTLLLNSGVRWVADQEAFLFKSIYLSLTTACLLYGLLLMIVLWAYDRKIRKLSAVGLVVLALLLNRFLAYGAIKKENSFWVFHKYNATLIGHQLGQDFYYFSSAPKETQRLLEDFLNSSLLSNAHPFTLKNFYQSEGLRILIIDRKANYSKIDFDPQYLILRNNPQINLEHILNTFSPKQIIADGSNSPWTIERWKKTCKEKDFNFYATYDRGALKISP